MKSIKGSKELALREHILEGRAVTFLEGMILFGVVNTHKTISDLRKQGYVIKAARVPYVKALRRVNEVAVLKPPENLPLKELFLTEYQLSR